jgi:hypothetical protein
VLRAGSVPSSPHNFVVLKTKAHLGPNLGLGSVSKDIIDIKNKDIFSCAKSRSKSSNMHICIKNKNIMHLPKRRKVITKKN